MFTGIVEQIGLIREKTPTDSAVRLVISAANLSDMPIGASIAVNGICLTAVKVDDGTISVDVVPETIARTNAGHLTPGSRVNLERPMLASGRFDGHIVQGHIDGVGQIEDVQSGGGDTRMTISVDDPLLRYIVEKGSVTVDGVSLTVASVGLAGFTVALIPHTLQVTTLGLRNKGDTVNLEMDVLAKYVERLMRYRE